MDHGVVNVIYLDRNAQAETLRRNSVPTSNLANYVSAGEEDYLDGPVQSPAELHKNVQALLATFNEVTLCPTGTICCNKLDELKKNAITSAPTIVLIDVPYDEEQRRKRQSRELRTPSPTSMRRTPKTNDSLQTHQDDLYSVPFLTHIAAEIHSRNLSKLVIPVVVLSGLGREWASVNELPSPTVHGSSVLSDTYRLTRYLDIGAVDVFTSPLSRDNVQSLALHAYRYFKDYGIMETAFMAQKRNRKLSWVGVDETKPYAYLREAMVSNLMERICNPGAVADSFDPEEIQVSPDRSAVIAKAIGAWEFSAHDFTDNELVHAALLMLQHALAMPENVNFRMPERELLVFLIATRSAYNEFVLYHNFRHVVDVLQACFYSLCQIGALPPYRHSKTQPTTPATPIASLLQPFDALTLLVAAIGHDVGHPGVNNAFLVVVNSPLAQLYNDQSVLESFHCAAYSQLLRKYWPACFGDILLRRLMINDILATDMGLHFGYMAKMGDLQAKFVHNNHRLDGWNVKLLESYRDLICGLLIKCADISNVARTYSVAAQWASILTDEFSNQGNMESELGIPTQLFGGPPVRDDLVKLAESQVGFINVFAFPLFENVAKLMPGMHFAVDQISRNLTDWRGEIQVQKARQEAGIVRNLSIPGIAEGDIDRVLTNADDSGLLSPRSCTPPRTTSAGLEEPRDYFGSKSNGTSTPASQPKQSQQLKSQPPQSSQIPSQSQSQPQQSQSLLHSPSQSQQQIRAFTANGHPIAPHTGTYDQQRADDSSASSRNGLTTPGSQAQSQGFGSLGSRSRSETKKSSKGGGMYMSSSTNDIVSAAAAARAAAAYRGDERDLGATNPEGGGGEERSGERDRDIRDRERKGKGWRRIFGKFH